MTGPTVSTGGALRFPGGAHGVCRRCSRRRVLDRQRRLCERCWWVNLRAQVAAALAAAGGRVEGGDL